MQAPIKHSASMVPKCVKRAALSSTFQEKFPNVVILSIIHAIMWDVHYRKVELNETVL